MSILAVLLLVGAAGSLRGFAVLFPGWLDAASRRQCGSGSFAWVELVAAAASLAAAYGIWRNRRWARFPFVVSVLVWLGTTAYVVAFGVAELGGVGVRVAAGLLLLVTLAVAGLLTRYVWRHT